MPVPTTIAYWASIARACQLADVPDWGPNCLRHNVATRFRREFGLDVARALLGHATPIVTDSQILCVLFRAASSVCSEAADVRPQ